MGGRIEGSSMNLKGAQTATIVFGEWHEVAHPHVVGVFNTEEAAQAVVEEQRAIIGELRLWRVWRSTFFVQG